LYSPLFEFSDLLQDAQSHLPIVEAIKSKDPEAARDAFLGASQEWLVKTRAFVFGQSESGQGTAGVAGE
jgi:DNA-binding GntR family transcriptional regulator